jgi:hypothetical protein
MLAGLFPNKGGVIHRPAYLYLLMRAYRPPLPSTKAACWPSDGTGPVASGGRGERLSVLRPPLAVVFVRVCRQGMPPGEHKQHQMHTEIGKSPRKPPCTRPSLPTTTTTTTNPWPDTYVARARTLGRPGRTRCPFGLYLARPMPPFAGVSFVVPGLPIFCCCDFSGPRELESS